ncbi:hypothetical protein SBOR_9627 [Sclerotinia borealis F-4128]|uniref:Uncharacterized protein n=1 Tax=Sclerotinia borealis (strain F-4128) TaxID=1432307 RepID=W9C5Z2_SCLBF|nr:hypothetical protein SBOR_9627 [Sclerotinia borealis F-4128]
MARSNDLSDRLRNEAESWVEISSQPSSSSISSIDNEIVTTGLRVSQHPSARRRRRSQNQPRPQNPSNINRHRSTSSQEEYEESESEPDHIDIITSSNEISPPAATPARISTQTQEIYDAESEDDEDENGTALGIGIGIGKGTTLPFTPQPNAFSHPPSSHSRSQSYRSPAPAPAPDSYFPRQIHSQPRPQSYPTRTHPSSRNPSFNTHSRPPIPIDHDAALRASLTTLLSCAAAARGLPKSPGAQNPTSNAPIGLRIVPESELFGIGAPERPAANISRPLSLSPKPSRGRCKSPNSESEYPNENENENENATTTKPKANPNLNQTKNTTKTSPKKTKKENLVKIQPQTQDETYLSQTLLTWVMSAGVVVLVSVVGFGAGYVIGREVGRQEVDALGMGGWNGWNGSVGDGGCGREVMGEVVRGGGGGGLRRFRWGGSVGSVARSCVA